MGLFWEWHQQRKINEAQGDAKEAKSDIQSLRHQLQYLQHQSDTLALACQALWELLQKQGHLSDHALTTKMEEVDLRDGKADGKITHQPVPCPSCQNRNKATRRHCIYCGARLSYDSPGKPLLGTS